MKTYKIDLDRDAVYVFNTTDHKYHFVARLCNFKLRQNTKEAKIRYFQHGSIGE